jgi:molybdopterin converting factor small subunit
MNTRRRTTATIAVRLYAGLAAAAGSDRSPAKVSLEVPAGTTVGEVCARLGIPQEAVHAAFVGKQRVARDYTLEEGDELVLFPPMAGG